jgi:hypothetical protein
MGLCSIDGKNSKLGKNIFVVGPAGMLYGHDRSSSGAYVSKHCSVALQLVFSSDRLHSIVCLHT